VRYIAGCHAQMDDPIMLRSFERLQKAVSFVARFCRRSMVPRSASSSIGAGVRPAHHEFAVCGPGRVGDRVRYSGISRLGIIKDWVLRLMFVGKNDHVLSYVLWG
jgi:hypothetical protein